MKRVTASPIKSAMLALLLPLSSLSHAIEPPGANDADGGLLKTDWCAYIGIGGSFGIWPDGIVPIAYNHANAPPGLDVASMERVLLYPAFRIIEGIADVHFDYRGTTDAPISDPDPTNRDLVAVIGWDPDIEPHVQAWAGPLLGHFNNGYGFHPYVDGRVGMNAVAFARLFSEDFSSADPDALSTMIHELLHVLGLGHPDHPISIMQILAFRFVLPQQDDITALQALYGPPDEFISPPYGVELDPDLLADDVSVVEQEVIAWDSERRVSADLVRPGVIDRRVANSALIGVEARIANLPLGTLVRSWWIDPLGNAHIGSLQPVDSHGAVRTPYLRVWKARYLPGEWTVRLAIGQALLTELTFEVLGPATSFNRSPMTRLDVASAGDGAFTLDLQAHDPESHAITTAWHMPSPYKNPSPDRRRVVDYKPPRERPARVFANVLDLFPDRGFETFGLYSVTESRYLVTPPETNVPTYFVRDRLLHIPLIEINGQAWSLDFRLTALPGITFKFLALNPTAITAASTAGAAVFDPTDNSIYMSKLIVVDGSAQIGYYDLRFEVDFDASPIRMTLR